MSEEKKVTTEETAVKEEKKTEIKFSLSSKIINAACSILALFFLAIWKIIVNFGVYEPVLNGIMSIFIILLAFVGVIIQFLKSEKLSLEFWFAAIICIMVALSI